MQAKAIRRHISQLNRGDNARQMDALDGLARFGPLAVEAVPRLIELLGEHTNCVRARAANVLGRVGPAAAAAVEKLNSMLGDSSPSVRSNVREALRRIGPVGLPDLIFSVVFGPEHTAEQACRSVAALGPDAGPAVPFLRYALRHRGKSLAREAARSLAALGAPAGDDADRLVAMLKEVKPANRPTLASDLAAFPEVAAAAVPMLQSILAKEPKENQPDPRPDTIAALGRLGPAAEPAVPELIAVMMPDSPLRSPAMAALGRVGPGAAGKAVPAMLELWPNEGEKRTLLLTEAFGRMGESARDAVPAMLEKLPEAYGALREALVNALSRMGEAAKRAVPQFVRMLGDDNVPVRLDAAAALGRLGAVARKAIPDLTRLLDDPSRGVKRAAVQALGEIEKADSLDRSALARCLADRDAAIRMAAARLMSVKGRLDRRSLDRCRAGLSSPYAEVRREAAEVLWLFTRRSRDSLPVIEEALVDESRAVRRRALELCRDMAGRDGRALHVLVQALANPDEPLGRPAGTALASFGAKAFGALSKALNDPRTAVRAGALDAMARIEAEVTESLPAVLKAADDEEPDVRWASLRVLGSQPAVQPESVAVLLEGLTDEQPTVRNWAALSLAQLGPAAVPHLLPALRGGGAAARVGVCQALALVGPPAAEALSAVGPLLLAGEQPLRMWATRVLDQIALEEAERSRTLMGLLEGDDRDYQAWAAGQLASRGDSVLPLLLRTVTKTGYRSQYGVWGAAECLGRLGESAGAAAPLLVAVLSRRDLDADLREKLSEALGRLGPAAVPDLTAALRHEDGDVRLCAADGLSRIGAPAAEAAPELVALLHREESPAMHRFVAEALADLGEAGVDRLIAALADSATPESTARNLQALGTVGRPAVAAAAAIAELLEHKDAAVRAEALWALGRVGLPGVAQAETLRAVTGRLRDDDPPVRERVPLALGRFGAAGLPAMANLTPELNSPDADRKGDALRSIRAVVEANGDSADQLSDLSWVLQQPLTNILKGQQDGLKADAVAVLAALGKSGNSGERGILAKARPGLPVSLQVAVVEAIAAMGPQAETNLRDALKGEHGPVRRVAFTALMGRKINDRLELATDGLKDRDWVVARDSAAALGESGDDAKSAVPALCEALRSPLLRVRDAAFEALKKLDPDGDRTAPALVEALAERDGAVRAWAAERVGQYGDKAAAAAPLLMLQLTEYDFNIGGHAKTSLRLIGQPAVPAVRDMLTHSDAAVRDRAFNALRDLDHVIHNALEPYRKQMKSPPADVVEKMDAAFKNFGDAPAGSAKPYIQMLRVKNDWYQKYSGSMTLARLARDGNVPENEINSAVKALTKILTDNDYDVRREAAHAVGEFGERASPAAEALTGLLKDSDQRVRSAAVIALTKIGEVPEATVKVLIKMLDAKKNQPEALKSAAKALASQGEKAAPAVKGLTNLLAHKDVGVRVEAARALGRLGEPAKSAADQLKPCLTEDHPLVLAAAATAYAKLQGGDPHAALEAVERALTCRHKDVQEMLTEAGNALGEDARSLLFACLNHEDAHHRAAAVRLLGRIDAGDDPVAESLERAADDADQMVRAAAREALKGRREAAAV